VSGRLHGKTAVVTAAAQGIGRAAALAFAREGANLAICTSHSMSELNQVADEARALGVKVVARQCDIAEDAAVSAFVGRVRTELGRIDVAVNLAGYRAERPLLEETFEAWSRNIAVNLTGAFLLTRAALRALREQGGGAIVHIASRAAIRAKEGHGAYAASKAGILQLTQMAAVEGARHGIRVNCVCPGLIDTPMTRGMYDMSATIAAWKEVCPLGRAGTPDDVAKAMLFLASDDACVVTGQHLSVNGGQWCS